MAETTISANNQAVVYRGRGGKGMAKLDAAQREALPKSEFAEPAERKFPVPDRAHAANAKSRAAQMMKKGHISEVEYKKIVAKADRVEDKTGGQPKGGE